MSHCYRVKRDVESSLALVAHEIGFFGCIAGVVMASLETDPVVPRAWEFEVMPHHPSGNNCSERQENGCVALVDEEDQSDDENRDPGGPGGPGHRLGRRPWRISGTVSTA
jgi:hypothetical protein